MKFPLVLLLFIAPAVEAGAAIDFSGQIEPILKSSCVSCHGPEKHKGGLRLDTRKAALKGGDDGVVIIPGSAKSSDLARRISLPSGADDVMPPNGRGLSKGQISLLKRWIDEGARWPEQEVIVVETAPAISDWKCSAAEVGAIRQLQSMGVDILPIATGAQWHEASLRGSDARNLKAVLTQIKGVPSLVSLDLARADLPAEGLSCLDGLTNLQALHLEHTRINDAALTHLRNLRRLNYLNLYDTGVTDAGLEELKGLTNLADLHLWRTKVTDEGVKKLAAALPECRIQRGWTEATGVGKSKSSPR